MGLGLYIFLSFLFSPLSLTRLLIVLIYFINIFVFFSYNLYKEYHHTCVLVLIIYFIDVFEFFSLTALLRNIVIAPSTRNS